MSKAVKNSAEKREPRMVRDAVLIGDWKEVQGINAQTIKPELAPEELDGLIIKGYEMKWGVTNENGEQYAKDAFDKFINEYFVEKGLNMPVDINHEGWNNWRAYCGRVLYIETNSVGFYFVVYVPKTYEFYEQLKSDLRNGIIQGFSKEGFASDWEPVKDKQGNVLYWLIKEIAVVSVSLVCTPANGIAFERMQEIKNALVFKNKVQEETKDNAERSTLEAMFN